MQLYLYACIQKAIHLEIVSGLSTATFKQIFCKLRYFALEEAKSTLTTVATITDNATNFKGVSSELNNLKKKKLL